MGRTSALGSRTLNLRLLLWILAGMPGTCVDGAASQRYDPDHHADGQGAAKSTAYLVSRWVPTTIFRNPSANASSLCASAPCYVAQPFHHQAGSAPGSGRVFEFAGWRLDVTRRALRSPANALVALRAAEYDLLLSLVERRRSNACEK
jgi:hypothetical protein